jgi:hypothetical protein
MDRVQAQSMRTRIQDQMKHLKNRYRATLKENELQEVFDELWPTWSSEMAAMIYAETLSVLDLLLLTSVIDNRREIRKLREELEKVLCI